MSYVILFLVAGLLIWYSFRAFKRNYQEIKTKNEDEKRPWKRGWNYFSGLIWSFYFCVFSVGLIANNLIFN